MSFSEKIASIKNRVFRIELLVDCLIVGIVGIAFIFAYVKYTGITVKSEPLDKYFKVQKLNYGLDEFLVLENKNNKDEKYVIRLTAPGSLCDVCGNGIKSGKVEIPSPTQP